MTWIRKSENKSWLRVLCENTLKTGPIPRHVAFIMDGNRRFANKNNYDRAKGHWLGFDKLAETLEWCLDLGITEVTVYAFSIENFKRSKDEVDCLMELAKQKFAKLMQEKELLEKHGVCFRVFGNISLLPVDIQRIIAEAVLLTKHNNRAFFNVAFSYTSRDEICSAMRDITVGVKRGHLMESDISETLLEKCFYTSDATDPDLLVRTSGEVRLSDFLLWQSSFSLLSFVKSLWPEFSVWHLYAGILHYQQNYAKLKEARLYKEKRAAEADMKRDRECVEKLLTSTSTNGVVMDESSINEHVRSYTLERRERIEKFLGILREQRLQQLHTLYPQYVNDSL